MENDEAVGGAIRGGVQFHAEGSAWQAGRPDSCSDW